jgi:lysozyme
MERNMSRLTASRAAFDLIQSFEGYRARSARLASGGWTLGFGHTATARDGLSVTRQEAEDLLRWDLRPIEDAIRQTALSPLTQHQFDALVSFVFNIGIENFRSSDVLRHINQGEPVAAALALQAWRRARVNGRLIVVDALVRRRAAEAALFLEPVGPRPAAPSPVVAPEIDYAAALLANPGPTHIVSAPLEGDTTQASAEVNAPEPSLGAVTAPAADASTVLAGQSGEAPVAPEEAEEAEEVRPAKAAVLSQTAEAIPTLSQPVEETQPVEEAPPIADETGPETREPVPMADSGLKPFPGTAEALSAITPAANAPAPAPSPRLIANDQSTPVMPSPGANSTAQHGLRVDAEDLGQPIAQPPASTARNQAEMTFGQLLLWALTALGAVLFVTGLWYAVQSDLSLSAPKGSLTPTQTNAILATIGGLLIFVSCALGLVQLRQSKDQAQV